MWVPHMGLLMPGKPEESSGNVEDKVSYWSASTSQLTVRFKPLGPLQTPRINSRKCSSVFKHGVPIDITNSVSWFPRCTDFVTVTANLRAPFAEKWTIGIGLNAQSCQSRMSQSISVTKMVRVVSHRCPGACVNGLATVLRVLKPPCFTTSHLTD